MAANEARKGWGKGRYEDTGKTKVYATNLGKTSTAVLRSYFEKFGEVLEAVVMIDRKTRTSKRYGFVIFKNDEAAERACEMTRPIINGKRILCRLARNRKDLNRQGESSGSQPQNWKNLNRQGESSGSQPQNGPDLNRQGESSGSQPQHCPGIGGPAYFGAPTSFQIGGQVVNYPQHEYTTCPRCGWNARDYAISQQSKYMYQGR